MFIYKTGDLLESPAEALVNTVNCEGYMGKGIAYQFKLRYPENFKDYQRACRSGELRPGKLHYYSEDGRLIINFPTKDKWRNPSKMEYIETGLRELEALIYRLSIKSIAIPPLGSGNGGLVWARVRMLIEDRLKVISKETDIYLYEPSKAYVTRPVQEPVLSTSALVLMEIKAGLNIFSSLRLQKAAYFMNVFSHSQYFKFKKHKYGPYSHSIDVISRNIKAYQSFHEKNSEEAKAILYKKIISSTVDEKLNSLLPYIELACKFVNEFPNNHDLECLATVCYLVETEQMRSEGEVVDSFLGWSEDKANRYHKEEIVDALQILYDRGIIDKNLEGYYLT